MIPSPALPALPVPAELEGTVRHGVPWIADPHAATPASAALRGRRGTPDGAAGYLAACSREGTTHARLHVAPTQPLLDVPGVRRGLPAALLHHLVLRRQLPPA